MKIEAPLIVTAIVKFVALSPPSAPLPPALCGGLRDTAEVAQI